MTQTASAQIQPAQPTSWAMLGFVVGVFIMLSGLLWAGATWQRISRMTVASGVVVQLDEYADDHGIRMYLPVVEFKTANGQTVRTKTSIYQKINILGFDFELDSVMGAPNQYRVGDAMQVYYNPSNPQDMQLNDSWQLWSTPIGTSAVGFSVAVCGLVFWMMGRRSSNSV